MVDTNGWIDSLGVLPIDRRAFSCVHDRLQWWLVSNLISPVLDYLRQTWRAGRMRVSYINGWLWPNFEAYNLTWVQRVVIEELRRW